jgi:hypothetical protein
MSFKALKYKHIEPNLAVLKVGLKVNSEGPYCVTDTISFFGSVPEVGLEIKHGLSHGLFQVQIRHQNSAKAILSEILLDSSSELLYL